MTEVQDVAWLPTMQLGGGYNAGSCVAHSSPFASVDDFDTDTDRQSEARYELDLVESTHDYLAKLGVSAQASMQLGGFTGETSASYAQEQSITSSSVFLVARVVVTQAIRRLTPAVVSRLSLAADVAKTYEQHPDVFLDHYGDHFVSGLILGGEFIATIEISTSSVSDKRKATASLKAGTKGGSFSGTASFEAAVDSATTNRSARVRVFKVGGRALHVKEMAAADFLNMANGFPREVEQEPVARRALLTPYDELTSLAASQRPGRADVLEAIQSLAAKYTTYSDALNDLEYMAFHKQEYLPVPDDAVLQRCADAVRGERDNVRHRAQAVLSAWNTTGELPADPGPAFHPVDDLVRGLPVRLDSLPRTALEVAQALRAAGVPNPGDGEYTVFLDQDDISSGARLYCHGMAGATPRSYVTLQSGAPHANTSTWPTSPQGTWRTCSGDALETRFERIRFDPVTRTVDPYDTTFAVTRNWLWDHNCHGEETARYTAAPYGVASANNHIEGADPDEQTRQPFGIANVDLRGTGLRIAAGVKWSTSGFDVKVPSGQTGEPAEGRRVVDVQVGGASGWIQPVPELRLELDRST